VEPRKANLPHLEFEAMSQVVRAGPLIVISGQVALGPDGPVGEGDARAQAEQCFDNLDALLEAVGARRENVLKLTCHLVAARHYPAYAEVKAARFGDLAPASTCVVVEALLAESFLMEIEALAIV
jgi:enamine deaminase RidA (YjgF/YER057c/UK114 family)